MVSMHVFYSDDPSSSPTEEKFAVILWKVKCCKECHPYLWFLGNMQPIDFHIGSRD